MNSIMFQVVSPKPRHSGVTTESDDLLAAMVGTRQDAYITLFDRYHQKVFWYFAVRTGGDITSAIALTVQTIHKFLLHHGARNRKSFPAWLFGIVWDVTIYDSDFFGINPMMENEHQRIFKHLRDLLFYQRETVYLRFFAGLKPKDISILTV